MNDWFQILSLGLNTALLLIGIKATHHLTKLEFKIEMMWDFFEKEIERRVNK